MKVFNKKNIITFFLSVLTGFINGLLGAGGGMVAVPLLKKTGFSQKQAQENAIAVILPITLLSSIIYIMNGFVGISDALPFIPGGLIGAFLGTRIIKKMSNTWLRRIFAVFMLYAGVRLLLK